MSEIEIIANKIKDAGGRLYLVGGAIRDELLGKEIHDEDYCVTGIEDFQRGSEALTTIPQDDMMVMAGFEEKQIDILLQIFREANIPFIPLKAIVTQTNVNWTFMQLLQNVKNEYIELTGMNKDKIN